MRPILVVLAVGAACSPPPAETKTIVANADDPVAMPAPRPPVPVDPPAPPPPLVHAVHGGGILTLAATEDGTAAVSADAIGVRLWPTLDGKHAPVVVTMPHPDVLAIDHDGDGFAIAGIDRAGGVAVVRTAADGTRLAIARVVSERRYRALTAIGGGGGGFIATRDDQGLDRLDTAGAIAASVMAPPATQILAVLHRRGHTLVLLAAAKGELRGQWLATDDGLAWGEVTPVLRKIDPAGAALAPDGDVLAASTIDHRQVALVDLRTGKRRGHDTDYLLDPETYPPQFPLGYADGELAVSDGTSVIWSNAAFPDARAAMGGGVATDRGIVAPADVQLELTDRDHGRRYLAYRIGSIGQYVPVTGGAMISDTLQAARIDDDFAVRAFRDLAPTARGMMHVVDRHHAINAVSDYGGQTSTLFWVDLDHPAAAPTEIQQVPIYPMYLPATHLLAGTRGSTLWFGHLDVARGVLDTEVTQAIDMYGEVYLTDPAETGAVAFIVEHPASDLLGDRDDWRVTPVRAIDRTGVLELGKPRMIRRDAEFWGRANRGEITNYGAPAAIRRTSPDHTLIAELGRQRITVHDVGGGARWSAPASEITDLAWNPDGTLVGIGSGLVRFAGDTGAVIDRQCGWQFGLWDEEPSTSFGSAMCDAE